MKGNSGRFTTPLVVETERLAKVTWVEVWADGVMTPDEETRMENVERVAVIAKLVDVTEELRNAVSGRDGIGSAHADRRYRELRKEWQLLEGGLNEPRPGAPGAAQPVGRTKKAA